MNLAPTRVPTARPTPDPLEVLIKEARRRGRRHLAIGLLVCILVVGLIIATILAIGLAPPSHSGSTPPGRGSAGHPATGGDQQSGTTTAERGVPLNDVTQLECTSRGFCLAEVQVGGWYGAPIQNGAVIQSVDGGRTWTTSPLPLMSDGPYVGSGFGHAALALGVNFGTGPGGDFSTTDGGSTWSRFKAFPSPGFGNVSCWSASECTAIAYGGRGCPDPKAGCDFTVQTRDGGTTWSETGLAPTSPLSLDCFNRSDCIGDGWYADKDVVITTSNGGRHWRMLTVGQFGPPGGSQIYGAGPSSVSCAGSTCFATLTDSGRLLMTRNWGRTWVPPRTRWALSSDSSSWEISCPSHTTCFMLFGGANQLWRSTDRGGSWHRVPVPTQATALATITCSTPVACLVGGEGSGRSDAIFRTVDAGEVWKSAKVPFWPPST
jgi:photosystem II stability/assembly factor-like uncharacterized protein